MIFSCAVSGMAPRRRKTKPDPIPISVVGVMLRRWSITERELLLMGLAAIGEVEGDLLYDGHEVRALLE